MIKQKLQELGFSEKEVVVYLALLEMGSAIASDIAKKAKLNRSTTYVILESLEKRGLISVTDRRGATLYNSTPPEQLIQYLEGVAKRYSGLASEAKKLLPELKFSRRESAPAPRVQLFEGSEGVKTVYEDTLASLEDMRVYASFEGVELAAEAVQKKRAQKPELNLQTI
jgi:sugar-specific transcriptional regulator TrmB